MSDANDAGAEFERQVANLYRMLGYDVTTNVDLYGFQTDLIVKRRVPGADETKLIVECKFKLSGTVSNEELSKLSNTFIEVGDTRALPMEGFNSRGCPRNLEFPTFKIPWALRGRGRRRQLISRPSPAEDRRRMKRIWSIDDD